MTIFGTGRMASATADLLAFQGQLVEGPSTRRGVAVWAVRTSSNGPVRETRIRTRGPPSADPPVTGSPSGLSTREGDEALDGASTDRRIDCSGKRVAIAQRIEHVTSERFGLGDECVGRVISLTGRRRQ